MIRNLHARHDFTRGDLGHATGHNVSRATGADVPHGSRSISWDGSPAATISRRENIDSKRSGSWAASHADIVGLAFSPSKSVIVATNNSLFKVDARIEGWPVP